MYINFKERIRKARIFINTHQLYMWLLIFIILVNALSVSINRTKKADSKESIQQSMRYEDIEKRKADFEKKFGENKRLVILLISITLMIVIATILGLLLNIVLLVLRLSGKEFFKFSIAPPQIQWTMWDVAKVAILFLSCTYVIGIFELILAAIFPFLKSYESLISMINTTILDTIGVLFVLYFTIRQYKHRFSDLGLSLKNFFRNVFYGITGYIATVPLLILAFSIIVWIANLFKYQPPPQPILEFFMEEKRASLLAYMSVFVAVLGPVAEEIFFRGFMYNAMKKATGLVLSIFLSAVFFALLHAQLVGFLPIMILGALLAYLYEKTGSLVPSITVHIIHNSVMVFFVFLMKGFAL